MYELDTHTLWHMCGGPRQPEENFEELVLASHQKVLGWLHKSFSHGAISLAHVLLSRVLLQRH